MYKGEPRKKLGFLNPESNCLGCEGAALLHCMLLSLAPRFKGATRVSPHGLIWVVVNC
jgi:hypothetical protein